MSDVKVESGLKVLIESANKHDSHIVVSVVERICAIGVVLITIRAIGKQEPRESVLTITEKGTLAGGEWIRKK